MKILLSFIFSLVLFGCAEVSYPTDIEMEQTSQISSFESILSSSSLIASNSSSSNLQISEFGKDLTFIRIEKNSHGAELVMKNNTEMYMSVTINYEIMCSINNKPAESLLTKTLSCSLNAYQQVSCGSIDGIWHGGLDTISCKGNILSITPRSTDKSNFTPFIGYYEIKS